MYLFLLFDIFDGCMIVINTVMMKRVSKEIGLLWIVIFDGYMVMRNTFMMKKGSKEIGLWWYIEIFLRNVITNLTPIFSGLSVTVVTSILIFVKTLLKKISLQLYLGLIRPYIEYISLCFYL